MNTVRTMAATAVLAASTLAAQAAESPAAIKNVVLVHGGFVDGSGWSQVYRGLRKAGYTVAIVQNPTTSLADDVAATKLTISQLPGPVVLVGHSYGGAVISEAGSDPKVKALVYIAAFAPDKGESVQTLTSNPAPGAPVPPILPPQNGFLFLDRSKFAASFAADVAPAEAAFMADSQVPWGVNALSGAITDPAWKHKRSWYLVAADDKMIPPPVQRQMAKRAGATVAESKGSHAIYVSQPRAVITLIEQAAKGSE
ncbi:MAG TPA: alpha/beta hydrolase [Steroidobacteraceae bacterium]|jgi:pimeloyl-ACP methyl ester carboxylesterase|nr:alpha/beta hydrolase [Steroidobacteraceae bacterium]